MPSTGPRARPPPAHAVPPRTPLANAMLPYRRSWLTWLPRMTATRRHGTTPWTWSDLISSIGKTRTRSRRYTAATVSTQAPNQCLGPPHGDVVLRTCINTYSPETENIGSIKEWPRVPSFEFMAIDPSVSVSLNALSISTSALSPCPQTSACCCRYIYDR